MTRRAERRQAATLPLVSHTLWQSDWFTVPKMSPNMNLRTITAIPSVFHVEDAGDPRFYIFATLTSGVLRFEVVARMLDGGRGSVTGKEFFAAMMAHFGGRINLIESKWSATSGMTTNLDLVNRATASGMSIEDAATLTWTGRRASDFGFGQVLGVQSTGNAGTYQIVRVQFGR